VIILLSCCLGIRLLALGFLLGRESNRAPATFVIAPPTGAAAAADPEPAVVPTVPPAASAAVAPAASPAAAPRAGVDAGDKQAIARYFREVDRLQNIDVDNPQAAAASLIGAASSGDTSGLRQLVTQAREAEQKARAITPPPPCAHYHKQLVSILVESRSMLQRLEEGIGGGNVEALPALLTQANAAKSRSESLAREARELKRRFGIAP
jgi:hypothetical protein